MQKIFTCAIQILFILYSFTTYSHSQAPLSLPKAPANNLKRDFPREVCDAAKELISLRKCRTELDIFLKTSLEAYNQDIQEYREKLNAASVDLESKRREGLIGPKAYVKKNLQIQRALFDSSGKGIMMKPYFDSLIRFREIAKWVVGEIRQIERAQIQLNNQGK